jgi:hypothetical protein
MLVEVDARCPSLSITEHLIQICPRKSKVKEDSLNHAQGNKSNWSGSKA